MGSKPWFTEHITTFLHPWEGFTSAHPSSILCSGCLNGLLSSIAIAILLLLPFGLLLLFGTSQFRIPNLLKYYHFFSLDTPFLRDFINIHGFNVIYMSTILKIRCLAPVLFQTSGTAIHLTGSLVIPFDVLLRFQNNISELESQNFLARCVLLPVFHIQYSKPYP